MASATGDGAAGRDDGTADGAVGDGTVGGMIWARVAARAARKLSAQLRSVGSP